MSPARRVLGYLRPYAACCGAGVVRLAFGTAFSLGIPWQVKEAVDGLRGGSGALDSSFQALPQRIGRIGARFPARHSESSALRGVRPDASIGLAQLAPGSTLNLQYNQAP